MLLQKLLESLKFPNQIPVDALMDVVTRVRAHGAKAEEVLKGAAQVLSEVVEQLLPDFPVPSSLPETVEKLLSKENLFDKYFMRKTKGGAKAALMFALASVIEGDFEKAFQVVPRQPDGKGVPLKPFADRAGKLSELLANLVLKMSTTKTSTSTSASVAP